MRTTIWPINSSDSIDIGLASSLTGRTLRSLALGPALTLSLYRVCVSAEDIIVLVLVLVRSVVVSVGIFLSELELGCFLFVTVDIVCYLFGMYCALYVCVCVQSCEKERGEAKEQKARKSRKHENDIMVGCMQSIRLIFLQTNGHFPSPLWARFDPSFLSF